MNWKNYGDINFLAYGGCLVKPSYDKETLKESPWLGRCYDVLYVNPEIEEENQYFAGLCTVDLDDDWFDVEGLLYAIGREDLIELSKESLINELSPELFAKELVEYYGISHLSGRSYHHAYPGSFESWLCTEDELKEWLKSLGAEEFIGEEE